MNQPLVSVIVSAYNHEDYVQEMINSIIRQTYKNIELLVINDGSTDATWQKMQALKPACEKRFARVVFQTQENQGTCKTFNKLICLARGEYLYFIASDDVAKPEAVESECRFLSQHADYALCVGDNEIIDSHSVVCYWDQQRHIVYDKAQARFATFADFLQSERHFPFTSEKFGRYDQIMLGNHVPNGLLLRKNIFDKIGPFTPQAPLEDYWLMLQISKYAKMKYLDKVLLSYRWHSHNTIKQTEKMSLYEQKTRAYEENLLKKLDFNTVLPIVKQVYENGVFWKEKGIPFLLEVVTHKKNNQKIKTIKIFNIPVWTYSKTIASSCSKK